MTKLFNSRFFQYKTVFIDKNNNKLAEIPEPPKLEDLLKKHNYLDIFKKVDYIGISDSLGDEKRNIFYKKY